VTCIFIISRTRLARKHVWLHRPGSKSRAVMRERPCRHLLLDTAFALAALFEASSLLATVSIDIFHLSSHLSPCILIKKNSCSLSVFKVLEFRRLQLYLLSKTALCTSSNEITLEQFSSHTSSILLISMSRSN